MSTFRFAVMGAGDISHKFCDAARRIPSCEICAVSSKSPERAKAFASREGIPSAYGSYAEMLEKENPDCVYIGADTGSHYSLTMLCLGHKTPVLCEKAQFCSVKEALSAMEFAKKQGVFMMEAMWSYFLPAIKTAKEMARRGQDRQGLRLRLRYRLQGAHSRGQPLFHHRARRRRGLRSHGLHLRSHHLHARQRLPRLRGLLALA